MSKRQLLCLLGVWVIGFLFLGFPSSWHKIIAIVTGLIIILIAYNLPPPEADDEEKSGDTIFVEHT